MFVYEIIVGNVPEVFFQINKQKNEYFKVMKKIKNEGECKV